MIQDGLSGGAIEGVIMSPRNEPRTRLASFLSDLRRTHPSAERLADPQFYAGTVPQAHHMYLTDYPHYVGQLTTASFQAHQIRQYVTDTLDWQYELNVSAIISPTVVVDDLHGRWARIATELALETVAQYNDPRPLLISLVVGEAALQQGNALDRWIQEVADLNAGFYLIANRRSRDYQQDFEPDALASLLRTCYYLAELRQRTVVTGYADMVTLLLHAVGVIATGAGWYTNLKQFYLARFERSQGGPPHPRYSSLPLLNSIFFAELDSIHRGAAVANVLSGTPLDGRFNGNTIPSLVPWSRSEAALHHWHVLTAITRIPTGIGISARLDAAQAAVAQASTLYRQMARLTSFDHKTNATHLHSWSTGLNRFRSQFGV